MAQSSRTFKAILLGSGRFLSSGILIIIAIVLTRILTKEEYATYRQTLLAYTFIAPLLMLGLPQGLYYFLTCEKRRGRGVLIEALLLLTVTGAAFSLFLLAGGNRLLAWRFSNPALQKTLLILVPYTLFMLPASAIEACLMSRDRPRRVAAYSVISRLVLLAAVLTASLIWRTPTAAVIATVCSAGLLLPVALRLMLSACAGEEWKPTLSGMRLQLSYSVPLGLASMIGAINLALDKVVVSSMCSPQDFAVYVNGAIEIPLVAIIAHSVGAVLLPDLVSYYRRGQYSEMVGLWRRATVKSACILIPAMFFLWFAAKEVVVLLFSAKYADSALPFRIYLLYLLFRSTSPDAILIAAGKTKAIFVRSLISLLLNLCLNIVAVHFLGYVGAAISTICVIYLWNSPYILRLSAKTLNVRVSEVYPFGQVGKIMLASGMGCAVFFAKPLLASRLGDMASVTILFVGYTCLTGWLLDVFKLISIRRVTASAWARLASWLGRSTDV